MKKALSLLLAGLLSALTFVSCGADKELLTYKYDYDLTPYITLGTYRDLPAEGYHITITDEQIEQQILSTRAYYSRSNVITDRGAAWNDIVYIDYVTTDANGVEVIGGREVDSELTLGFETFPAPVEESLLGTQAGDHRSVDATLPDPCFDYPELAGQTVHFEIDVKEVREQELPEYNEDFVRAYLGYDSIADFEESLHTLLEEHYHEIFYEYVIAQTWPTVLASTTVLQYPEKEVQEMYDDMVTSNKAYAQAKGLNFADFLKVTADMTEEEFYTYAREEAEARVKEEMVCYAIARAENISLSEEEYTRRATEYAVDYYGLSSLEEFEAIYDKTVICQTIMMDLVQEKVADLAVITYLD